MLVIGLGIIVVGYGITLLIARPVIGFLFLQRLDDIMVFLPLTTATIMLTVLASILQPFVLKYCKLQWQIAISAIGFATYFVCALVLWRFMGLTGFCIGTIIGAVVKLVIVVGVYYRTTSDLKAKK